MLSFHDVVYYVPTLNAVISDYTVQTLHGYHWTCLSRPIHTWMNPQGESYKVSATLQWRHNGHDSVSNHQPHDCLLNRLFRRKSKKTSKLRVTGLCAGIHRWPVNSPQRGPVTRKMFPFDDVIMDMENGITGSTEDVFTERMFPLHHWLFLAPIGQPFMSSIIISENWLPTRRCRGEGY